MGVEVRGWEGPAKQEGRTKSEARRVKATLFDVEQTPFRKSSIFRAISRPVLKQKRLRMTLSAIQMEHWVNKQRELDHLLEQKANLKQEARAPKEVLEARLIGLNKRIIAAEAVIQAYESQSKIP